jgi:2-(3-amino-3-carboxypropyl)histidine synthase
MEQSKKKASESINPEVFQDYDFDLHRLLSWIKRNNIQNLGIQLPEGLKLRSNKLVGLIENELNINVILLADPCFGACDIPHGKIKELKIQGLVHFGHSIIPNCKIDKTSMIPMEFVELHSKIDPAKLLVHKNNIDKLSKYFKASKKIGLITNIQYVPHLKNLKLVLESAGFKVIIGSGGKRVKYSGQVLGCNFSAAFAIQDEIDTFMFIGDGNFHPIGIRLSTKKPVIIFDPVNNEIRDIEVEQSKLLRQRAGAIARAKDCRKFGILLSTKPGQTRFDLAMKIKNDLTTNQKSGTLIAFDYIFPENVDYLPFEAFINTACPRLTIDDYLRYKKPIITPIELEIVLNNLSWDEYTLDEIK